MKTSHNHRHQWDLSPVLSTPNEAAILADRAAVRTATEAFVAKWRDRDDYLTSDATLREALDDYEAWQAEYGAEGRSGAYFWLREQQNEADPAVQAGRQLAIDFAAEMSNLIQFFPLQLARIAPDQQRRLLKAPMLRSYRHFLERLFATGRHRLSEAEERILTLKDTTSHTKWTQLTSKAISTQQREVALADGTRGPQTYEELSALLYHADAAIRDEAAAAINNILATVQAQGEAELNAILANKKVDDQLRGFARPDAARHLTDDIDTTVVDALLEAVSSRNDLAHRYYRLKAKLLNLPQLKYHERNLSVGSLDRTYTWEEATRLVDEVYTQLDPRFGQMFRQFLDRGQFDVYPRPGKRSGAFCVYFTKNLPTYLMLNYTGTLKSVTTLAHELGHGLNDEFMRSQNALNFGTPLATAEVASQYLEDFVYDRLVTDAGPDLKLAINMNRLGDAVNSIFRQVAGYRFEQDLHAQFRTAGYLTADQIGQLFQHHMASYMGPAVEQSPGSQNWWLSWHHIRVFFYVYSYASGLLIAKAMQQATRQDRAFLDNVKIFLSAGHSASPRQVFNDLGIDITDADFWHRGLDEIERLLGETEQLVS